MTMRLAADALVLLHFAFVAFVVAGGALALVDRRWAIIHLPAVAWAAWTEFTATVCPLTPWENLLRANAGKEGYSGGFVEHYIVTVIYPQGLTSDAQFALGVAVVFLNAVVYAVVWRRGARPRRKSPPQHMTRGA
jgi:uncharacterized protein DUF2784